MWISDEFSKLEICWWLLYQAYIYFEEIYVNLNMNVKFIKALQTENV